MLLNKNIVKFYIFFSFVIVASTSVTHAKSLEGTKEALEFFEIINNKWEEILMPLARRQASRDLRRLSNSLYKLSLDKQEFTESLLSAYPDLNRYNAQNINEKIDSFKNTTQQLRRDLKKFTLNLPDQYQKDGSRIANNLFTGLSTKWQTLDEIARWVTDHDKFSKNKVVEESKSLVLVILKMKQEVDSLIAKISDKPDF